MDDETETYTLTLQDNYNKRGRYFACDADGLTVDDVLATFVDAMLAMGFDSESIGRAMIDHAMEP